MAEIELERKPRGGVWPWVIGVIVAILLIWWIWPDNDLDEVAVVPAATEEVEPGSEEQSDLAPIIPAGADLIVIAPIVLDPDAFIGQTVSGIVEVPDVPTDRGFWVEHEGQRVFAIIIDQPEERPVNIEPGQKLRLTGATIRDASYLDELPGAPLDADTRRIAESQEVFLVVDEAAIEVIE